jgi:hypothetical protein
LAPLTPRTTAARTESLRPAVATAAVGGGEAIGRGPIPAGVGYQSGPTQREKDRFSKSTLNDPVRDLYVPIGLLIAGFMLYVIGYTVQFRLGASGMAMVGMGVGIITAIKAILLIIFALVVAGPLGVSFGDPLSAILKLASLAVFSDGVLQWVDMGMIKLAGQGGAIYGGIFNLFIAAAIYWLMLIYLFSMDSEDSWIVVCLLAVFDNIVRWAILLLILSAVMNLGGVPTRGGGGGFGGGGGSGATSSVREADGEVADRIDALKTANALPEAKEYIAGGRQAVLTDHVNAMYEAGAVKIWFECSRDINARLTPEGLILELPRDKAKRKAVLDKIGAYEKAFDMGDGAAPIDEGQTYVEMNLPG